MTAVMRAMSVATETGPRVIRVGVVRGGRVVEERLIKQRVTVTIGSSETATFVLSARGVPPVFPLFELVGNDYCLNLLDGMKGRIALPGGITEINALHGQQLKLTDEARGKVVIGETTLLFQFVAAPPLQPRPRLPLAVKGGLASNNDWALTFIAAFSFLFHFGIVGAMYSDWSDPIVDDRHEVAGLVDMVGRLPLPPVEVPDQNLAAATPTTAPPAAAAKSNTDPSHQATGPAVKQPSSRPGKSEMSDQTAAALAARGAAMQMEVVAGLNEGPSVANAIKRSLVPGVDLSGAAEQNIAVTGNSELKTNSGGPVQANHRGGLAVLGGPTKREGNANAGPETNVAGPTGVAQLGSPTTSAPIPNVEGVVAGLRGRFRSCYQTGLLGDSTMSGKVLISARVGPNGEVSSSDILSMTGLSPAVGQCIAGVVKRATFSAPGGGGSVVQIPVTFLQNK